MPGWTFEDNLDALERALINAGRNAVDETAQVIKANARKLAPVDTSAMKTSIHVVTSGKSEYPDAKAAAIAINPAIEKQIVPPISVDEAERGVVQAIVDVPLEYADLVEHGHYNVRAGKHMKPQPFLKPAGDGQANTFRQRVISELDSATR
jgi:HK97 gp10 family phage protein